MYKKLLAISLLFSVFPVGTSSAQAPDTLWTRMFGNSGDNYAACVLQADDGGFVLTGSTNPYAPDSCPDLYLMKANSDGSLAWERTFGGSLSESGRHVSKTSDGGYIISGETESFGEGEMEYPDVYLIKTDSAGTEEWYRTFSELGWDSGEWVEQTADGGYIIVGMMDNSYKLLLIKTDAQGYEVWRRLHGEGWANGKCVQQTGDGGYIIGGGDYAYDVSFWGGYLLKVDSLGYEEWYRHYDDYDI